MLMGMSMARSSKTLEKKKKKKRSSFVRKPVFTDLILNNSSQFVFLSLNFILFIYIILSVSYFPSISFFHVYVCQSVSV